jgi:hypothetical protein
MKRATSLVVLHLLSGLVGIMAAASPLQALDIPAPLEPWKAWVLHHTPDRQCPARFDNATIRRCWWPSHLVMDVGNQGGLFTLQVTVYASTWVTLPGGETHWPEAVTGGNMDVVVARDGLPCIWLEPGEYLLNGAFIWNALPEVVQVPASVGLVSLTIDGREIAAPDLDADGRLRLHGRAAAARREDALTISLFRLIEDDIPMRITTRALVQVSGRPREIRLASLLPDGATAMKIDSPLPVHLKQAGDLLVQARPGNWDIRVTARLDGPVKALSAGAGLYGDEVWSFKAFNHLRMVKVLGAPTIEPSRSRMPDEWKGFPAYLLRPGGSVTFEVVRRGDPDPAPDQLNLTRAWWLDFDGSGLTVHDRISGTLSRNWHLSMGEPMQLGRVSIDGLDQLITLQGDRPTPGVQLRRGQLSLEADSRLSRTSPSLPAIGWDHDFQNVRGVFHLPPGWRLLSAAGVDVPSGAWLQRWTLLDFFLVLVIAVSAYQIRNRLTGLLAFITLALTFHEPGAPRHVWLHLVAVAALLKYLPDGWFRTVVKGWGAGAVVALIAMALPFMVQQVRTAIYPQLARSVSRVPLQSAVPGTDMSMEQVAAAPEPAEVAKRNQKTADKLQLSESQPTPLRHRFSSDPDALIQTGPGLPEWQWQSIPLRWNGPVDRTQRLRLWLLSPTMNLALGLIRVVLLLALMMAFLDLRNWRRHLPKPAAAGATSLIILFIFLVPTPLLQAETVGHGFPPQSLLDELQRRLHEPPPCLPRCADVSRLELTATPDQLRLIMQVHAQTESAIPLPATLETWHPDRIVLDNEPVESLARDDRGTLWMVLPQGVHQLKMTGPPGVADEIRISFPMVPHVGTYAGVGWQARGFGPDSKVDATIALTRVQPSDGETIAEDVIAAIPAFFHVAHTLHLGFQWKVTTHIHRLTEPGQPAVLSIPLLDHAAVTTAGIQVHEGFAQVALGPEEMETQFTSIIPIAPSIRLTAPHEVPWTETWTLDATTMWRCSVSGLTVVHHQDIGRNWQPQWRPWPGEQVSIDVVRPEAIAGRTITIDRAQLALTPGQRFSRVELSLGIRSSRGAHHQIELPAQASLQAVTLNGHTLPIRQDGQLVTIPLEPGAQTTSVVWQQLNDSLTRVQGPQVNVGGAAANAAVAFHMPDNRWILLAGGPRLGPAVLFWSDVIVVVLIATLLGKTTLTPLGTRHWLLLGLGLTQVPVGMAIIVVGWLLALEYRCRKAPLKALAFNGTQLLLVLLTAAALVGLYTAIQRGLLGTPDMQIAGNHSTRYQLNWFQDRVDGTMPIPWVISLPQWIYHVLMLAWSLWLAFSLVSWLRWGWRCFSKERLWMPVRWRRKPRPSAADGTH